MFSNELGFLISIMNFFPIKKILNDFLNEHDFRNIQKFETFLENKLLSFSFQFQLLVPAKDLGWLNPKARFIPLLYPILLSAGKLRLNSQPKKLNYHQKLTRVFYLVELSVHIGLSSHTKRYTDHTLQSSRIM